MLPPYQIKVLNRIDQSNQFHLCRFRNKIVCKM